MIKITCSSCQKPLSLDETKLPMKDVSFPCPVCKAKLTVDRRTLERAEGEPQAPRPPAIERAGAGDESEDHGDEFGAKALIVGTDHPALRQALKLIGFLPVHHTEPGKAREFYMQEFPQVVVISPQQITAPPLEAMQPIISLTPADRRKSFFILVSDNLRTLDGNAAFLYGVNLVVAPKDLPQFPQIYRDAHAFHERLYAPMNAVLKAMHV
jgi:predicted RNA-binding Zn-ribbon protein involved in translation (DUF1610 family)